MDHVCVVEHFDTAYRFARWRVRCETCPFAEAVADEADGYDLAEWHFDHMADLVRLAELQKVPA
jgi:hypothetical protein